jgi:hypothetical protein
MMPEDPLPCWVWRRTFPNTSGPHVAGRVLYRQLALRDDPLSLCAGNPDFADDFLLAYFAPVECALDGRILFWSGLFA